MLVGIVALIFLGPRKLPEMAKKMGKIMSEFRSTTNEFKETWQREVNFEEEAKALNLDALEAETIKPKTQPRAEPLPLKDAAAESPSAPEIKEVDPSRFEHMIPAESDADTENGPGPATEPTNVPDINEKGNWL